MSDKKKDNAAEAAAKKNSGLMGRAARGISGRQRQIDDAVDEMSGAHDRQHTDKSNK